MTLVFLPVPSNARDIGRCIYCGSTEEPLTKEHALPYALNGPWTLLRATCKQCSDITSGFERDTARGLLLSIRTVLAMQTRTPKKRPKTLPLVVESDGLQTMIDVAPTEFPLYLPTPLFPSPGAVEGRPPVPGISTELKFIHIAGPSFEEISKRHRADFIGARLVFSPELFARTLAKIAFCAGVHTLGLAPLRDASIRRAILGKDPCVGHWVGSWNGEPMNEPKGLHAMQIRASGSDIHVVL